MIRHFNFLPGSKHTSSWEVQASLNTYKMTRTKAGKVRSLVFIWHRVTVPIPDCLTVRCVAVLFCFAFWNKVSLCSSSWPRTTYTIQVGFVNKLILSHLSSPNFFVCMCLCVSVHVCVGIQTYGWLWRSEVKGQPECHSQKWHPFLFFFFFFQPLSFSDTQGFSV